VPGIIGSKYVSNIIRLVAGTPLLRSLGASGGVMTLLAVAVKVRPDVSYSIIFFPTYPFSGDSLLALVVAVDVFSTGSVPMRDRG